MIRRSMKTMQDLGFLKLTIRNLVVCERGKLARLSVQDIHKEFLEHRIRFEALPDWDVGVGKGHMVLVSSLESYTCSVGLWRVGEG